MSDKVQLLFRKADENDVMPVILAPLSGFREDSAADELRQPLEWGVGETLALIGVVVSVAQLAVSIYEILSKCPKAQVELRALEPAKDPVVIEGKGSTPEEIARRIDEAMGRD